MAKELKSIIATTTKIVSVSAASKVTTPVGTVLAGNKFVQNIVKTTATQAVNAGKNIIANTKIKKHNDTIAKWLGLRVKEPGVYTYECVAWVKTYVKETMGITIGSFGGSAKNAWTNKNIFKGWKFIPRNASGIFPPVGAVVVWDNSLHGHIAIADAGCDGNILKIIDQNGGPKASRGTGTNGNEIKRRNNTYSGVVGWIVAPGWEGLSGQFTDIAENTQADGVTVANPIVNTALVFKADEQTQQLLDFFNKLMGVEAEAELIGPIQPRTEFEKFVFSGIKRNNTIPEDKMNDIKENLNSIMIATMVALLSKLVGATTDTSGQNQYNQDNVPAPSSADIYSKLTSKAGTLGDLRNLASQYPRQAWAKNNNPAGLTWSNAWDAPQNYPNYTAGKLHTLGIQFSKGTQRPEGNNYVSFNTMDDGLVAQRIVLGIFPDMTVRDRLKKWVGTANAESYATEVLGFTGIGNTIENKTMSQLSEDEMNKLQMAVIRKESGGLYSILTK